jgi:hypothetical protein
MYKRQLILLVASLALLFLFFLLPMNRRWYNTLVNYWNVFPAQKDNIDTESRLRLRFGNHYTYTKAIGDSIKSKAGTDALVLIPPTSYLSKMGVSYHVPVPPVFYYYTGVKTVWANNPHAAEANWYVRINNGRIVVEPATDKKALQDTIAAFIKLGVQL